MGKLLIIFQTHKNDWYWLEPGWSHDCHSVSSSILAKLANILHEQIQAKREPHYNDVIMGARTFQITSLTTVYSTGYSEQIKENVKAQRDWPLCGKFTGDRWIPRTNGQ